MCRRHRPASCISASPSWRSACCPSDCPQTWREPPLGDPALWQLGLFAVAVGLPFVAVAANAPLLQAWFARSGHQHAQDPYFLYGASNLGSLIALLGYPFLFEPAHRAHGDEPLLGHALPRADRRDRRVLRARAPARRAASVGNRILAGCGRGRADVEQAPRLVRPGAGAGGAAHGVHDAHRHRHRLGPAAVGHPAGDLPADLRARLPVAPAAARCGCCCRRSSPP